MSRRKCVFASADMVEVTMTHSSAGDLDYRPLRVVLRRHPQFPDAAVIVSAGGYTRTGVGREVAGEYIRNGWKLTDCVRVPAPAEFGGF